MSNLYRGPSIDASYQVSVHLAEGFQRRRLKYEKLTDDRRRTPSDGKSSHCSREDTPIIRTLFLCKEVVILEEGYCNIILLWAIMSMII
jgi:hypothetical protein